MVLARAMAQSGRIVGVWSWRGEVRSAALAGDVVRVTFANGDVHEHARRDDGWHIDLISANGRRALELGGQSPSRGRTPGDGLLGTDSEGRTPKDGLRGTESSGRRPSQPLPARFDLGAPHYRRSEESWDDAGRPSATIFVTAEVQNNAVTFTVDVSHSARLFLPIDAANPFDNEPMAINGDGVQLYVTVAESKAGWLLVPVPGTDEVSLRPIDGWTGSLDVSATWAPLAGGYRLTARVEIPAESNELLADVLVNETSVGRERRRGQLVLSGAEGEFVYLRGDRHESERLLRFSLPR